VVLLLVTLAVKVTDWPGLDGLSDAVTLVEVGTSCKTGRHAENAEVLLLGSVAVAVTTWEVLKPAANK
jgi:hypothetical protein